MLHMINGQREGWIKQLQRSNINVLLDVIITIHLVKFDENNSREVKTKKETTDEDITETLQANRYETSSKIPLQMHVGTRLLRTLVSNYKNNCSCF